MSICRNLVEKGDLWWISTDRIADIRRLLAQPDTVRQRFAEVILHDGIALKKIRYQKFADYIRKPFRSQARRELLAARWMREHGIETPTVYGYGLTLSLFGTYESLLLMEEIPTIGTGLEILPHLGTRDRKVFLERIRRDVALFLRHNTLHKDAHYGNILVREDLTPVWIDNDIRPVRSPKDIGRFLRKLVTTDLLTEEERAWFFRSLPLPNTETGTEKEMYRFDRERNID
ncbi:hypothetical protein [Hydrogenimonas sp.]